MMIDEIVKESFVVIGKEGSTLQGTGFIQTLWGEANAHFNEIKHLASKDQSGNILAMWGVMSDLGRNFMPWENNFTEGLYLAGVECAKDAIAPEGWTKWVIPGYEYIRIKFDDKDTFAKGIEYLKENNLTLVGAVFDYNDPQTGQGYMFFPIRKL